MISVESSKASSLVDVEEESNDSIAGLGSFPLRVTLCDVCVDSTMSYFA
jgi:hypothetical protein